MQKYEIKGRDAEAMLNRMVTRDVTKIGSTGLPTASGAPTKAA